MPHIKKKIQFQKVLEEYDFMKKKLEISKEEDDSDESILTLNFESLNQEGCERIFFMLRHILTLQTIILKNDGNQTVVNDNAKLNGTEKLKNVPVLCMKYALKKLYQAITDYLYNSDRIKILALKNIPITCDLPSLCQGIRSNRSIRVLHFEDCDICDDGCIQICQALRKSPIESFGLENCKVTMTGASWLAWLIREQSMLRTLTTWNKYQNGTEYKTEQGIRKLIINDNPGIKDTGAKYIVSTLLDDNWLTHIHMQNTGLSDVTSTLIYQLLKQNKSITLFDIARNYITGTQITNKIEEALAKASKDLHNETVSKAAKKNFKNKKKKLNKKRSKNNTDKLLSDKSQQTSVNSLQEEPFLQVSPNQKNENYKISRSKSSFQSNEDIILYNQPLKVFNNDKEKPKTSLIQQQFDCVLPINPCYKSQSNNDEIGEKCFHKKGKIKATKKDFLPNLNSPHKQNSTKYQGIPKGVKKIMNS